MPQDSDAKEKAYLDTFVFMDILSGDAAISEKALWHLENAKKSGGVISSILLAELAYHMRKRKSREKAEEIIYYIMSIPNLEIVDVNEEIAKNAGLLRAKYRRLKLQKKFTYMDCLHISTAIFAKCARFVTGDKGFKDIKEIEVEIY